MWCKEGKPGWDGDTEGHRSGSKYDDDAGESEGASNLITTSCEQQVYIKLDYRSNGGE